MNKQDAPSQKLKQKLVETYRDRGQVWMLEETNWYAEYVAQEKKDK